MEFSDLQLGDLIEIKLGNEKPKYGMQDIYRIMNIEDNNIVYVMAMYDMKEMAYNDIHIPKEVEALYYSPYGGTDFIVSNQINYYTSTLNNYLNNDYFNSLNIKAKNSIITTPLLAFNSDNHTTIVNESISTVQYGRYSWDILNFDSRFNIHDNIELEETINELSSIHELQDYPVTDGNGNIIDYPPKNTRCINYKIFPLSYNDLALFVFKFYK